VRRHAGVAALLAASVVAAASASAFASGTYTISACSPTNSAGAWQQVNSDTAGMTSGNECGGPADGPAGSGDSGALYGEDLVGSSADISPNAQAGWSFTAPAGTTISSISYYRALYTGLDEDWTAGLFNASGTGLDTCDSRPDPCSSPNTQEPVSFSDLDTSGLFFGVACLPFDSDPGCLAGGSEHVAQAQMYSAEVTLAEVASPSLSNLGGSLWSGGVVSGTAPVAFDASDPSGIAQVAVDGSGGQVAEQSESCDYTQTAPCPQLPSGNLSVNTTMLADGAQTLTLLVTNAAGNTETAQSPSLVVDNNGPPAPTQFSASAITGSTAAVQLTWSDPLTPPEPIASAEAEVCQTLCGSPVALAGTGSAQLAIPGPGTYNVRLWLIDTAGRGSPTNAATTTVTVPSIPPPEPSLQLTHKLSGHKLTLTATAPTSVSGPVTFTLLAYHHSKRIAHTTRRVSPDDGTAVLHLRLSKRELKATKISVSVSAADAHDATVIFKG
jgi:hypothetical protein